MEYYVNKEIFVVAEDEMNTVEIVIYDEVDGIDSVVEYLQTLSPIHDLNTKVYHGVLTPAEVLPSSSRGKKCFILVMDLETGLGQVPLEGCVFESDCKEDISVLAEEIEHIVNDNEYVTFPIGIENLFVLYGYSVEVTLSVNDEEVDEEVIDTCKKIAEEVMQICQHVTSGDQS